MQVRTEDEMAVVIEACLGELEEIEAAFIRECHLREPRTPLATFAKQRQLSQKELAALRNRTEGRLKEILAAGHKIHSVEDFL